MGDPDKGEDGTACDHWFDRVAEFICQMNFDGCLGEEVDLMTRCPSDDARGQYSREPVWPEGRMPDVQTNQCLPYLEWHMPKELKTGLILSDTTLRSFGRPPFRLSMLPASNRFFQNLFLEL
jgi:hypothetical protein